MKKVVLDTGPWISALGVRGPSDQSRQEKAKKVLALLTARPTEFTVYYSQRSELELPNHMDATLVFNNYQRLPYHSLDETWGEVEGTWENWGSMWDDVGEEALGATAKMKLPDKPKKSNQRDRGICGDAILEKCQFLLHENPRDMNRLVAVAATRGLVIIDLFAHTREEIEAMLSK